MAVQIRGSWGLPQCAAFRRNHPKAPGGLSIPEGLRRLNVSAFQKVQAGRVANRQSSFSECYANEAAGTHLFNALNFSNASEAISVKGQALGDSSSTIGSNNSVNGNGTSSITSSTNDSIDESNARDCIGDDAEALQDVVEKSFSVFDLVYRNSLSPGSRGITVSATQDAQPTRSSTADPENAERAAASTHALPAPFPSSKTQEGPSVLLSVLRDLINARLRTPEAWAPPLLLLMQQLPLLSSSQLQQTAALLASAGCRPPLLLQGLCEAFSWRAAAKRTEASQTILFLDSLRRLRYLPCVSHLRAYFAVVERRRKSLTVGDLLKIQRFLDELSVPSDLASSPFLVSILPQLKRNTAALKPPEAAALASLLLKRQELDRETAECLSAAVYEHLGGTSSLLFLQQEPISAATALHNPEAQRSANLKSQYLHDMLQRQKERLASPSTLSCLLHLGNSLVAANLKQVPSEFCWALEREVELHWAAMTPMEVSATLNLLAKMKHRPTSALNKLGLAVQHSLHLFTPNLLAGCLSSFDVLLYNHRSLLSSLSAFLLNKQIAPPHHQKQSQSHRQQYPRPSPRFVGKLSAVSATMPTAAATSPGATATAASSVSLEHGAGPVWQHEQELPTGSAAGEQTTRLFSSEIHGLQPPKRLPPDAHLPPPIAAERYTCEDEIETAQLLHQEEKLKDTFDLLDTSGEVSPGVSALTAAARRPAVTLQAETESAVEALPVHGTGTPYNADASIDPFLAAVFLQHLSHIQHSKDPELLSRLLASVSAATAHYGQQRRLQQFVEQENFARLHGSHLAPVTRSAASSRPVNCVESVKRTIDIDSEMVITNVAAAFRKAPFAAVASSADRDALTSTGAALRRRCGFPIGTHELRETWAEFASAAITAAVAFSPRWGRFRGTFSGPTAEASRGQKSADNHTRKGGVPTGSCGSKVQASGYLAGPSDQDTVRRLKEQGLHKALQFVTLPWSIFVSQFRKTVDLSAGRPTPGSSSRLPRKGRGTRNGFVPAGAEVTRIITKREALFAHLYRIWGSNEPPGLSRLRRRYLRRVAMKMRAGVSRVPRPSAGLKMANGGQLCASRSTAALPVSDERRKNIVYGKCAADSMRRWACCRRAFLQPFQLVSLYSRSAMPTIGVEAAESAKNGASEKGTPPLTDVVLPQQQLQMQLVSQQKFPFGISFADTAGAQAVLIDTGPLLPPVLPRDAPSSLKKQIKRQHDKKMRYAAQAQARLQRHQQRWQTMPTQNGAPSIDATTVTATAETANPKTVQTRELTSASAYPSALHSTPTTGPMDLVHSAATPKPARARKDEQHRSRLLRAVADALSAAANMRVLTLRVARPFVMQLPLLCAESPWVATGTLAAVKDLSACCTAAAAALQTLGLRLDEPLSHTHTARRRNPRPPTPDLPMLREELLISVEMALRSPRFLALWRQVARDAASFEHCPVHQRAEDNPQRRLSHLLPQAAYLYSVVFQALVNDLQKESTLSALINAWQQHQQQNALQFCDLLGNAVARISNAAIANLPSFAFLLNACRCLSVGVASSRSAPEQQQSKQALIMLLRRTEKTIMRDLEQALTDSDANTEEQSSKDIRLSLVALIRSHEFTWDRAPSVAAEIPAKTGESVHPVVYELANKMHLTSNTLRRWVVEAAISEELRFQRSQPT